MIDPAMLYFPNGTCRICRLNNTSNAEVLGTVPTDTGRRHTDECPGNMIDGAALTLTVTKSADFSAPSVHQETGLTVEECLGGAAQECQYWHLGGPETGVELAYIWVLSDEGSPGNKALRDDLFNRCNALNRAAMKGNS